MKNISSEYGFKVIAALTGRLKDSDNLISFDVPIDTLINPEPSVK